ncbi:MAG: hypothetical protein CUN49_00850 [Candidatus Thermofonsia Clade 1 bacterium]|jgi:hypothetical protein|uniref:Uncharacterized protein n=1 Tax=Candidatus Thermofonsia Clade 1 bacterium TaxID=2364210 RepID=A0A2M8PIG4_9CHLR|nr:MAG: hypothetical protein CUN49_00850 [Candidatus Thermofonsia Clade 1 bacterium]RMF53963.1 MAG: hypothetical protein D6749_00835 [Chloroflexota bacterium]
MSDEPKFEQPAAEGASAEPQRPPLAGFVHHQRKAAEAAIKALGAFIPPDFFKYSREAREEYLKSFKVLIEGARATVEREIKRARGEKTEDDQPKRPSTTGKTKVKVEVS